MSYANKGKDSRDTARLRAEYEKKKAEYNSTNDAASKAKLKDDVQKSFGRVVEQINGERKSHLSDMHKVLAGMGRYKTDAMIAEEKAKTEAGRAKS